MGYAVNAIGHKYIPQAIGAAHTALTIVDTAHRVKNLLTRGR